MPEAAHMQDAARLRDEIRSYSEDIKRNNSDALARIDAWTRTVTEWFEPASK